MRKVLLYGCAMLFVSPVIAQHAYEDYVGAGHSDGVQVTSSDEYQAFGWNRAATASSTVDGSGLDAPFFEAARFLMQASLGADQETIEALADTHDFEAWIDAQVNEPYVDQLDRMREIIQEAIVVHVENGGVAEDYFYPGPWHFNHTWWQTNMTNTDLLRQRAAMSLSEILVVSMVGGLEDHVEGVADYHDMLISNAFGNYREIMAQVTLHPTMGVYLSHFNNPLNIDSLNIHPDENYAREVMQLFSIGLYELNIDGTRQLDAMGEPIPTYGIPEIKEFSKIFTGLGPGGVIDNDFGVTAPYFGLSRYLCDFEVPMAMYEDWHEQGPKTLLNGFTVPAGQTGIQDVQMAIDNLFNHPNVGPFLARRLIQNLVKSNPTPAYIQRVAESFNDNGDGVRGDMVAVYKAILLDEEARSCEWIEHPDQGKLISPHQRYSSFARNIEKLSADDRYWNTNYAFLESTEMIPFASRSVFNFYSPDFKPAGAMSDAGLYGPEYQIHNSLSSIGYVNHALTWTTYWALMFSWDGVAPVFIDIDNWEDLARDPEVILNELDRRLTRGQMSDAFRADLKEVLSTINLFDGGSEYLRMRAELALYLTLIHPDHVILK